MLRQPIHGFAKRVDDTVARAIAILQRRPDVTTGSEAPTEPSSSSSQKAT
jgi:hypothetical protein